jgi:helicase, recD/traA family
MNFVTGEFRKDIFCGTNGYLVALFKVKDTDLLEYKNKTITVVGNFLENREFDTFKLYGHLVEHNKFGEQFNVVKYEKLKKEGKENIVNFLSSDLFKGIGITKAVNIYKKFKDESLDIIKNNSEKLFEVKGISIKDVNVLHDTLISYENTYNNILKLTDIGFSMSDALKITNIYLSNIDELISRNLYDLYFNLDISFNTIDKIALMNKYSKTDKLRLKSLIIYTFKLVTESIGHIFLYLDELYKYVIKINKEDIDTKLFLSIMSILIDEKLIIKEDKRYYLTNDYLDEVYIAKEVVNRLKNKKIIEKDIKIVEEIEEKLNISYNIYQKDAILKSLKNNFLVITGGPGTGKTTVIYGIYRALKKENPKSKIKLLAPTGRASKRLSELTLEEASTIHRFLEWNKDSNTFSLNEHNKSDTNIIIVDEFSMVNNSLFASLLRALKPDTKIILVGDKDQLPSVGSGNLLADIISSIDNVVYLKELYRQAKESSIVKLAYAVNLDKELETESDDELIIKEEGDILDSLKEIALNHVKDDYKEFQVLVPLYKGSYGINNINKVLQEVFNKKDILKNEKTINDVIYREKDKVIQLVNMPDNNVFNGDIGIIEKITDKEIIIDFDGNKVKYTSSTYNSFALAYAISIHKSQGSEFKTCIIPLSTSYSIMLYRKLYYTAITRAKKKLYLLGNKNILKTAAKNNTSSIRNTYLKEEIKKLKEKSNNY